MKTGIPTLPMQRSTQYRKKSYKKISKVVLSFTVPNTYAAFETWIVKGILCLKKAPALGSLSTSQSILQISLRISWRTRQFLAPQNLKAGTNSLSRRVLYILLLCFLASAAAVPRLATDPLTKRAGSIKSATVFEHRTFLSVFPGTIVSPPGLVVCSVQVTQFQH